MILFCFLREFLREKTARQHHDWVYVEVHCPGPQIFSSQRHIPPAIFQRNGWRSVRAGWAQRRSRAARLNVTRHALARRVRGCEAVHGSRPGRTEASATNVSTSYFSLEQRTSRVCSALLVVFSVMHVRSSERRDCCRRGDRIFVEARRLRMPVTSGSIFLARRFIILRKGRGSRYYVLPTSCRRKGGISASASRNVMFCHP